MAEEIIIDLINKYDNNIIMLDSLLQWALNPTSMSASYGIKENYPYIKKNLKLTHLLSDSKAEELISKLEVECETFLKLKKDKYSIGNFQKLIIEELSKNRYIKLFEDLILKKKKKASKNAIRFLQIYKYCPIKNYPCLNVQYNAIYGEEIDENEIVSLGILKPLYWISSGNSRNREIIPKFIPFLDVIIDNLKLKKIKSHIPNPAEFIQTLKNSRDWITLDFLINLMKRDQLCDILFNNQKVYTRKGIVGFYSNPHSKDFNYAGISFLVKEQLYNIIEEFIKEEQKEKSEKIIKILEFEIKNTMKPSDKDLVRIADINIDELEVYEELMNELPQESFSENQEIKNKASEAIKQFDNPSLYDLLITLNYDIETARKVGKYLIDSNMIKEFSRVPKDILTSTPLKLSQKPSKVKKILCKNCKTPLTDRENQIYCPFCGSSDIERT